MSIFEKLRKKKEEYATKRSVDTLLRGVKHECFKFVQKQSEYLDKNKKYPMTPHAYVNYGGSKYFTVLPNIYNDLEVDEVNELNASIQQGKPPSIVFYGKDGIRNEVDILENGQAVDVEKVATYLKKEEEPSLKSTSTPSTSTS